MTDLHKNHSTPHVLMELQGIAKSFSGIPALHPLDLLLPKGKIIGLIGENGAGKSTLIKLLSGVLQPNEGVFLWEGNPVQMESPRQALERGIVTIHQELAGLDHLSVSENLFLDQSWPRYPWGGIQWSALHQQAQMLLDRFQLPIQATQFLGELSAAQKQEIAIISALSRESQLLILDEPTASLSDREVQRLLQHLKHAKERGLTVLYVSHRLQEIKTLTDEVLVLRDGHKVAHYPTSQGSIDRFIQDMVGRPRSQPLSRNKNHPTHQPALEVSGLGYPPLFDNISFRLHQGEIVGLAGLVGAGRSELGRALFGLYPATTGTLQIHGNPWAPQSPQDALSKGLIYFPEERKRQGFHLQQSVLNSLAIGFSDTLARWGLVSPKKELQTAQQVLLQHNVKRRSLQQTIATLSGGNQQKCLIGRWLERDPSILILDEPTRGVDVEAKAEIHRTLLRLASEGKAILLISSDMLEILDLSDRILVMCEGRLVTELVSPSETELLKAASPTSKLS